MKFPELTSCTVAVMGLGYVGLPIAIELSKSKKCLLTGELLQRRIIGFDVNKDRLKELNNFYDRTNEVSKNDFNEAKDLIFTNEISLLSDADVFIITVPTPIDSLKRPDLSALKKASKTVSLALCAMKNKEEFIDKKNTPIIIYESTVYPGATEEVCIPILEESGLALNSPEQGKGFCCGYSPERINPGDKEHKLTTITKVTSGSNSEAANWVDNFYGSIIQAGTYKAKSIKVAEAAKVIENTQRDLNIALVNEFSMIFRKMEIDTLDVLDAARSKWNFLDFRPGLVGGHCIGVDPYYLTYKSEQLGYSPQVVLAGRRMNDGMSDWIIEQLLIEMSKRGLTIGGNKVLILGLSFKENCPDLRNTKVADLVNSLAKYSIVTDLIDNYVDPQEAKEIYNINVLKDFHPEKKYSVVIAAVRHQNFVDLPVLKWKAVLEKDGFIIDLKGYVPRELNPIRI
ncbi:nucleotide sugar dehydrogenase [Prochlorococcus marinus]|uniref:nucleotide sugar dehydrogenase n=1 Tax=Prochlorococcus marinus TaxID=1219 RepID=UPI0022B5C6BC|nr:nucleotide sugar dehydrogenase [Prochlorococcus marinus]